MPHVIPVRETLLATSDTELEALCISRKRYWLYLVVCIYNVYGGMQKICDRKAVTIHDGLLSWILLQPFAESK